VREEHLRYLCCPACRGTLALEQAEYGSDNRVEAGDLRCHGCGARYSVVRYVPRFVSGQNYADGFGLEWNIHRRTQYDRTSGIDLSERRFYEETNWPTRLENEVVVEAGSGSGRFTEVVLRTGATVLSLDYSSAVDANYASNGDHENLLLVQGDLFNMPFPRGLADRLFCFGVLQHTPDPPLGFESLTQYVRPGGAIVADIYAKTFVKYALATKYWVRPVTRRIPPAALYRLTARYVDLMWPLARQIRRIPRFGRSLNWRLLIGDYSDVTHDDEVLKEWARLDTFDMLSPRYDKPASFRTVQRWCSEVGLASAEVLTRSIFIIRGRRPERLSN
jgi:SAM-dependent methyltransferase